MIKVEFDELVKKAEERALPYYSQIESVAFINTQKVMDAFAKNHVSDSCFNPTTGYGYDDKGRTVLEAVFADIFHAESALVRPQLINGTHAIACGLYGLLRTGDTLLCVTGMPYDTLCPVIFGDDGGSLKEYGVKTIVNDLFESDGMFDFNRFIDRVVTVCSQEKPTAALIQRSKGYLVRPSFSPEEINLISEKIKSVSPETKIMVDNCYGEFTSSEEPLISGTHGVDLICGSLIKNPGGGLAPTGGYLVGLKEPVFHAACRFCVPGIGGEAGSYAAGYRLFYQGLFVAPHVVAQSLKTAVFAASLFDLMGYDVSPKYNEIRNDIIQTISLNDPDSLLVFMRGIQAGSPVDSYVSPEPWEMPGYDDQVVMAAGTFISGASIELSADGPMRDPYTAYLQGGITYESGKIGIIKAAEYIALNC